MIVKGGNVQINIIRDKAPFACLSDILTNNFRVHKYKSKSTQKAPQINMNRKQPHIQSQLHSVINIENNTLALVVDLGRGARDIILPKPMISCY